MMKQNKKQPAEYSFWDNLSTDLRRWLFFIPAIVLIAAVLCRRWIFGVAAAASAALLVWLLLRGDRCPFCDGELSNK